MTKAALAATASTSRWLAPRSRTAGRARSAAARRRGSVHRAVAGRVAVVSPIILPGPLVGSAAGRGRFLVGPGALLLRRRRCEPLRAISLYTAENVAIAVLIGAAIGVTLGLLSARVWFVRAAMDPIMMTAGTVPDPHRRAVSADLVRRRASERGQPRRILRRGHPLCLRAARGAQSRPDLREFCADARRAASGGCCETS